MPKSYWVMSFSLSYVYDYQGYKVRRVVTFMSLLFCLSKTTSCASGSEKLLAMYQKSPPKVLY